MSPARETSAITFGAAAALVASVLSRWIFVMPLGLMLAPMVAVGGVAAAAGALVGEGVARSRPWRAALIGAMVLPAVEVFILGVLFAADTVQRFSLNRPPHWGELLNPTTWALVIAGAVALSLVGAAAGLAARFWAQRATAE